ncbi:MAG: hypothetical protein H7228_12030 [Polaromonas sp.]|nr:hypothetical protein [Polaromonas sp.]
MERLFLVTVKELQVYRSWGSDAVGPTVEPPLTATLRGVVALGQELSVIGSPQCATRTLILVIYEEEVTAGLSARKVPQGAALGLATIVPYTPQDVVDPKHWELQCSLPSKYFTYLVETVESRKLEHLFFRLSLNDLYSNNHWMDSGSENSTKFLKPSDSSTDTDVRPRNAWGHIEAITFKFDKFTAAIDKPKLDESSSSITSNMSNTLTPPLEPNESGSNSIIAALRKKLFGCVMLVIALIVYIAFK